MPKTTFLIVLLFGFVMFGCGPDTIFLRPRLDTPSVHVANGNNLLERGKVDDAHREFQRAKTLDPNYTPAYIGLGIVLGRMGRIDDGLKTLDMASEMADNDKDRTAVEQGYLKLHELRRSQDKPPKTD
jgi:tetratricopeptide (TPR) repeat protein